MELWIGAGASVLALGFGIFLVSRPDWDARRFALFALGASAYVLSLALLFFTHRFIFSHLVIITGAFTIGASYIFVLHFRRMARAREYFGLLPITAIAFLAPTGLLIEGARQGIHGLEPVSGPLAPLLVFVVLGYCISILTLLCRTALRSAGAARAQAAALLAATTLLFLSIFLCNVLGPQVGFSTTNMFTGLSLLLFLACVTYALTVQGLFQINLLLYRFFATALGPFGVLGGIAFVLGIVSLSADHAVLWHWLLAASCGAVLGVLFVDRMRPRSVAFLRRLFSPDVLTPEQRAALVAERRLVADIAHGLQTPLAVLRAEVEGSETLDKKARRHMTRMVDELSVRMRRLITYGRAGMPLDTAAGRVRLDAIACEIAEYVGVVGAQRGVTFHANCSPATVLGRTEDLEELVTNLLSNALEYAARGSGLHEVFISCEEKHHVVLLTIADTGPGMSEEERQRACEPLYRAPGARVGQGMGLGLAIARQVAVAHGGSLVLAARPGGGTVATVQLPAAPAELLH